MGLEIRNKGFTLIEVLVALTVFSLVIVSMSAIAVSMIKSQRKAFALQNIQEPARYILESMSKEIRMSVINSAASGSQESSLDVTNDHAEDIVYEFSNDKLYRRPRGAGLSDDYVLNPTNLEVTGGFYIRKSLSRPVRAVVTVVMKIKSIDVKVEKQAEIYIQSTMSSREF